MRKKKPMGFINYNIVFLIAIARWFGCKRKIYHDVRCLELSNNANKIESLSSGLVSFHSTALLTIMLTAANFSTKVTVNIQQGSFIANFRQFKASTFAWALFKINAQLISPTLRNLLTQHSLIKAVAYWHFSHYLVGHWQTFSLASSQP